MLQAATPILSKPHPTSHSLGHPLQRRGHDDLPLWGRWHAAANGAPQRLAFVGRGGTTERKRGGACTSPMDAKFATTRMRCCKQQRHVLLLLLKRVFRKVKDMNHNKKLTTFAQQLRREMTKEERKLWYHFLRDYPLRFRRQVTCGQYIVDFYCARAKLAIELDGSQHFQTPVQQKDDIRTEYLNSQGVYVFRIPNNAVWDNFDGVCEMINLLVEQRTQ